MTIYTGFVFYTLNISTHTSLVGCDGILMYSPGRLPISTHTSLVGCDTRLDAYCHQSWHFYSHIPCGMWHRTRKLSGDERYFYSHIPCGMWLICLCSIFHFYNFYSHIPCGMWLVATNAPVDLIYFYSHIPCGMWQCCFTYFVHFTIFLLTHPLWDVTFSFP